MSLIPGPRSNTDEGSSFSFVRYDSRPGQIPNPRREARPSFLRLLFVGHAAEAGALDKPDVFRQRASRCLVGGLQPGFTPGGNLGLGQINGQQVVFGIDGDAVSRAKE